MCAATPRLFYPVNFRRLIAPHGGEAVPQAGGDPQRAVCIHQQGVYVRDADSSVEARSAPSTYSAVLSPSQRRPEEPTTVTEISPLSAG